MIKPDGQILVIFGASGDLTKRKLLPSLYELFARDMLPENFVILGVARTPFSDEEFRIQQKDNLKAFLKGKHPEAKQLDAFLERVHYLGFNSDEAAEYHLLVEKIAELRKAKDIPDHLIFYLATPPQKYGPIAEALRKSKLNKASEEGGWRRIIVEKPFGSSLETAQALNKQLCSIFDEEDIYRIATGEILKAENGQIPAEEYEKIMTTYFLVFVEQIREHCGYDANSNSYPYEMIYARPYPPFGEVVDYTKNADGTITLIVDGVWPDYNSDLAFRNTVVVQPFEDGTFRYLSNSIEQIELELPPIARTKG